MSERITQLEQQLADTSSIQEKIEVLNALSSELRFADHLRSKALFEQSLDYLRQSLEMASQETKALQNEISEHLLAEHALQQANEQLRREIVEREQLICDLNAFSHMVAHDLKTPINALNGYSYLLANRLKDTQDITTLRYLEIIEQTSLRMNRIIDGLLILASVREQEVESNPLDMAAIINEVLARLEHHLTQYQAEIIQPPSWPTTLGYTPWIEEVWANYISNAVKYGGSPPVVTLGADPPENGMVRFWVQDNGDGLSLDDQSRLFTAFSRLEHTASEGHGLGLSIVKRIVEKQHGDVGVASQGLPNQGSTFSFTLPVG